MRTGDDDELTLSSPATCVERAAKGELFRLDGQDLHWIARDNGQGRIGGTRVHDNDLRILNRLLHDAAEQPAGVLRFIVAADDN